MPQESIHTISPSTGKVIIERPGTTLAEAQETAKRSKVAFKSWQQTQFTDRKAIVEKAFALIQNYKDDLGRELTTQMGRPIAYSAKEIETVKKRADYLLETAEEALAPIAGRPENGFKRSVRKEAVGPTLIIFAWNVS